MAFSNLTMEPTIIEVKFDWYDIRIDNSFRMV